jgi:hypothetical protein
MYKVKEQERTTTRDWDGDDKIRIMFTSTLLCTASELRNLREKSDVRIPITVSYYSPGETKGSRSGRGSVK